MKRREFLERVRKDPLLVKALKAALDSKEDVRKKIKDLYPDADEELLSQSNSYFLFAAIKLVEEV